TRLNPSSAQMEAHRKFTKWALDQGVEINSVAPHRFPGKGLGIIAEKDFKAGEILLKVPTTALRTVHTVPKSTSGAIGTITVHGLLAAELSLDTSTRFAPWQAVLPTHADFLDSMPLLWDARLQELLPEASKTLLDNQKRKLTSDWAAVSKAFPQLEYEKYLYNWLIVNTRTFYFVKSKSKKQPAPDDCMALNPFADYFNHASAGAEVSFTAKGYQICTHAPVKEGDEIYISYGTHSNDFLLVEYGFIFPQGENAHDNISLDSFILPLLNEKQREILKRAGYLGKYVMDRDSVCYRTQIALQMLCLPLRKWQRVVDGLDDGEKHQGSVDQLLATILSRYHSHTSEILVNVTKVDSTLAGQETLSKRWEQIRLLIQATANRIQR
ncbi:SET domain-containing protein, partial [Lachnellula suecica]